MALANIVVGIPVAPSRIVAPATRTFSSHTVADVRRALGRIFQRMPGGARNPWKGAFNFNSHLPAKITRTQLGINGSVDFSGRFWFSGEIKPNTRLATLYHDSLEEVLKFIGDTLVKELGDCEIQLGICPPIGTFESSDNSDNTAISKVTVLGRIVLHLIKG